MQWPLWICGECIMHVSCASALGYLDRVHSSFCFSRPDPQCVAFEGKGERRLQQERDPCTAGLHHRWRDPWILPKLTYTVGRRFVHVRCGERTGRRSCSCSISQGDMCSSFDIILILFVVHCIQPFSGILNSCLKKPEGHWIECIRLMVFCFRGCMEVHNPFL